MAMQEFKVAAVMTTLIQSCDSKVRVCVFCIMKIVVLWSSVRYQTSLATPCIPDKCGHVINVLLNTRGYIVLNTAQFVLYFGLGYPASYLFIGVEPKHFNTWNGNKIPCSVSLQELSHAI